ncbi:subtype B tannase [Streptomyces sp. NPDC057694]|uniref:subtype B tannase n=1 Tax=Streptomyces sp. NPDC057694 TaxID=3346216 RepID=UPI003697F111
MKRRTVITGLAAAAAVPATTALTAGTAHASTGSKASASTAASANRNVSLLFDRDAYSVLTTSVTTGSGDHTVTYHFYKALTYVAKPVDAAYQSLNISVPVSIDGKAVDASHAPIMLANTMGGYSASSVAAATGVGANNGGGPPAGGMPTDATGATASPSASNSTGTTPDAGNAAGQGNTAHENNALYALANGWVVVEPGVRGRENVTSDGTYYGKAPACIVDLKAAVRYLRFNKHRIPGNTDWIVSSGGSAGAALSSLLGASGDSALYHSYLKEIGAADESDAVFATTAYSPIADLEHSDMAYEWMFGSLPLQNGSVVDQTYSTQLRDDFADYLKSLRLRGVKGYGTLTADNYADYMVKVYLEPSATEYLAGLSAEDRAAYLADNTFINWSGGKARFSWDGFLSHIGSRSKDVPSFDALDLSNRENEEFGDATTNARHFTLYSLREATGDATAPLDVDLPKKIKLMNPMYFVGQRNPGRSRHWWLRTGALDTNTSHPIVLNLAAGLNSLGDDVNSYLYWDGGHAVNEDADDMIAWVNRLTGHRLA